MQEETLFSAPAGALDSSENLCMELLRAEGEEHVVRILRDAGYWEDASAWRAYGDNENNFSTVGNQQAAPEAALVEKLINSVDAILMREALRAGIDPEEADIPGTAAAVERFFGVSGGLLTNITPGERTRLAEDIQLVATGASDNPCYSIIDQGEGQSPDRMPETLLSLAKSNKLRIPFVQGKFNMGSAGALRFCSPQHNFQLIISRRDQSIVDSSDQSGRLWGFTILRRVEPQGSVRSSSYRYLAPGGNVPRFAADAIPALPGPFPTAYAEPLGHGTVVKLYQYQLPKTLRTNALLDLNYRLSLMLPQLALPVRISERRHKYSGHSLEATLAGLSVRLDEDRAGNLEAGFPASATLKIAGQETRLLIYAFKPGKKERYAKREGIVFAIQGQSHGSIDRSFFSRTHVGMSYLENSLLILADCSSFDARTREDLFMNSRDRLAENDLRKGIEENLTELISSHQGLRELRERRRKEELASRIGDAKPLQDALTDIVKRSPVLEKLLISGGKLGNPFRDDDAGTTADFKGVRFPTFFRTDKEFSAEKPKHAPCNHRFRVSFHTDAENQYFERDTECGWSRLLLGDEEVSDYSLNLWDGRAHLSIALPSDCASSIGNTLTYRLLVGDPARLEGDEFASEFNVLVGLAETYNGGKGGPPKKPAGGAGDSDKRPSSLSLPLVTDVTKEEWEREGMTKESALRIKHDPESGYDFYVNIDNIHLRTELKSRTGDGDVVRSQYRYALVLLALAVLRGVSDDDADDQFGIESNEQVEQMCDLASPFLIPMVTALGSLGD